MSSPRWPAMMPHGQALVDHVARGVADGATARHIATTVGYKVNRCATLLAECGHAPLARVLLERDAQDTIIDRVSRIYPEPEPEPASTGRPAPTAGELMWELEDAYLRGASFDDVAATLGVLPGSLRRRLERLHLTKRASVWFPRLGRVRAISRRAA